MIIISFLILFLAIVKDFIFPIGFFFVYLVFFQEHSQFIGHQGKRQTISLTLLYQFGPLQGHLDIR